MPAPAIPEIPIFQGLKLSEREELNEWVQRQEFDPGALILQEGDPDNGLYILAKGRASILKRGKSGQVKVAEVEGPTVVGEMGLLTRGPRAATIRAESQIIAGFLPAKTFDDRIQQRHPIAMHIAYNLGHLASLRLAAVLDRLVELTEQCNQDSKFQDRTENVSRRLEEISQHILHDSEQ